MGEHTGGVWEAVLDGDARGQPQVIYRGLVCVLSHSPEARLSVVTDGRACTAEEWPHNAALIAAAPDLLKALSAAREIMRRASDDAALNGFETLAVSLDRSCAQASAAIAKATPSLPDLQHSNGEAK